MRTQRKIFTLLAIVTWTTTSSTMFGQQVITNGPDPEAGSVLIKTMYTDGDLFVQLAGQNDTCSPTGGVGQSFNFNPNPYIGNVFRVDDTTTLNEIFIELDFGTPGQPLGAQASFSIHQAPLSSNTYTPVFVQNPPITLTGTGPEADSTGKLYSSGQLPIAGGSGIVLNAGFKYAIGITWDATVIRYFRDTPITNRYPQDFPGNALVPDGAILGSVGKLTPQNLPLIDNPFFLNVPFNSSAYSMELCLDPKPGACCDAARPNGCEVVLESDCTAAGSFFQGQNTVCEPGRCQIGSCCLRCDDGGGTDAVCADDYVRERCEAELGDWQGSTVTCAAGLCPIVSGACCVPNAVGNGVTTVKLCESECILPIDPTKPDGKKGVYHGDGSPLVPSPCLGACCTPSTGCRTLSPGACAGFNGVYRGNSTVCNNLDPALECGGACCFGTGGVLNSCSNLDTRADCVDADGIDTAYGGDSSTCGGTSCSNLTNLGACCLPDGTCVNATVTTCASSSMLGVFNATCVGGMDDGLSCELDSECTDDVGTCGMKLCIGGTRDGLSCNSNLDCLAGNPSGQCVGTCMGGSNDTFACLNDAGCPDAISTCVGMSCDAVTCDTEECCFGDGHCEDISANACILRGASPGGMGTTCSAASCSALRGSCCLNDGTCSVTTELDCNAADGRYLADGSVCTPTTCSVLGSCCRPNHSCSELVTSAECALFGGLFNADPDCANAVCPGTGGCCTETATCLTLSDAECMAIAGDYKGDDTVCGADAICPTGACCSQTGVCSNVNQFVCDQISGSYLGDLLVCNVDAFCSTGACCLPDASCADLTELGCASNGGIYHGDDTICPDDSGQCAANVCVGGDNDGSSCAVDNDCHTRLCAFGSCCETTGNCVDGIIALECDLVLKPTATFTLDATCADCPQEGACCFGDESCVLMLETDCIAANGFFQGELALCPASGQGGLCTLGACCELDGTCNDGVRQSDCNLLPFSRYSAGQLCSQINCQPRGACCMGTGNCVDDVDGANCTGSDSYAGDGSVCQMDTCEIGACCLVPTCEGGLNDGMPCDLANGNDDCDDIVAICSIAGVCHGGPRQGLACTIDNECPLSNCLTRRSCLGGVNDAQPCTSTADCVVELGVCSNGSTTPACVGGPDDGNSCDINNGNADCNDNAGTCEIEERVCDAGSNVGMSCTTDNDCSPDLCIDARYCEDRGSVNRKLCTTNNDCDLSVCGIQDVCLGGTNKGGDCTTDSDCPFAVSICLQPGICRNGANPNEPCFSDSDCLLDVGICYSPDHCGSETNAACRLMNGLPQGAGTTCSIGDCVVGACCNLAGVCIDGVPISACDDPGDFRINESCGDSVCEVRGACCHAGGCDEVSSSDCIMILNGIYEGDASTCDPADLCSVGACCMFDGSCAQSTRQSCEDGGGIYAGSSLLCDGSVDCNVGSCCLTDGSCMADTVVSLCDAMNGTFTLGGDCTNVTVCLQIDSSDPASGVSDARIPHERNNVSATFGTDRVIITFNADATSLIPSSFNIVEVGGDANVSVPTIVSVNVNVGGDPNVVALNLNRNLDISTWSTITHIDSGSQVCLGVAPGDVDSNGTVDQADLSTHVINLDSVGAASLSTDIDRSGSHSSLDLIELIDLQTGADTFIEWRLAPTIGAPPCN